jgi:DNA-binding NarL/FixJ family response regulator
MKVIGTASTGAEAIELFQRHRPDVVLMDLQLPGMRGIQAIEAIRREDSEAKIVVLTMYGGDEDIHRAIQAGAASYLLKDTLSGGLAHQRRGYRGGSPFHVRWRRAWPASRPAPEFSTVVEVIELLAEGKRNRESRHARHHARTMQSAYRGGCSSS